MLKTSLQTQFDDKHIGHKLLFDSSSLKDLLNIGSNSDNKNKKRTNVPANGNRAKPSKHSLDLIQMVLKEETGGGGALAAVKKPKKSIAKKRKQLKNKVQAKFNSQFKQTMGGSLEQARLLRLAYNNVYEFASSLNLPRNYVDIIERQYFKIRSSVLSTVSKVIGGYEQLNGNADSSLISAEDVALLLQFAGMTTVDSSTLHSLLRNAAQRRRVRAKQHLSVARIQSVASHSLLPIKELSFRSFLPTPTHVTAATVTEVAVTEPSFDDIFAAAEQENMLVDSNIQYTSSEVASMSQWSEKEQLSAVIPTSAEEQEELEGVEFADFVSVLRSHITLKAMTVCLGEMKGLVARHHNRHNDLHRDQNNFNDSQLEYEPPNFHNSDTAFDANSLFDTGSVANIDMDQSLLLHPSHQNSMIQSNHPESGMFVSSSSVLRPVSDPRQNRNADSHQLLQNSVSHQSIQDNNYLSDNSQHFGSEHTNALPPLRLMRKLDNKGKRKLLSKAGFDESLTRGTPRVLQNTGHNAAVDINALRYELQIAQEGVKQLGKMVDTNIAWVQSNCDMSGMASHFSSRTKHKCKAMSVERIFSVYCNHASVTLLWAMRRWRTAAQYVELHAVSVQYARIKGIDILTNTLYEVLAKQLLRGWTPFYQQYKQQKVLEFHAATSQIQRIVRGFLGRDRVKQMHLSKKIVVMQQLFRKVKAKEVVKLKRQHKHAQLVHQTRREAAKILQQWTRDRLRIKAAKAEANRRRKAKAAEKIQKIHRGKVGRSKYSERLASRKEKAVAVDESTPSLETVAQLSPKRNKSISTHRSPSVSHTRSHSRSPSVSQSRSPSVAPAVHHSAPIAEDDTVGSQSVEELEGDDHFEKNLQSTIDSVLRCTNKAAPLVQQSNSRSNPKSRSMLAPVAQSGAKRVSGRHRSMNNGVVANNVAPLKKRGTSINPNTSGDSSGTHSHSHSIEPVANGKTPALAIVTDVPERSLSRQSSARSPLTSARQGTKSPVRSPHPTPPHSATKRSGSIKNSNLNIEVALANAAHVAEKIKSPVAGQATADSLTAAAKKKLDRNGRKSLTNDELVNPSGKTEQSTAANRRQSRAARGSFDSAGGSVGSVSRASSADEQHTTPSKNAKGTPTRSSVTVSVRGSAKNSATKPTRRGSKDGSTPTKAVTSIQKMARGKLARAKSKKELEKQLSDRALAVAVSEENAMSAQSPGEILATIPSRPPTASGHETKLSVDTGSAQDGVDAHSAVHSADGDQLSPLGPMTQFDSPPRKNDAAVDKRPRSCSPSLSFSFGAFKSPLRPFSTSSFFKSPFHNPFAEWLTGSRSKPTSASDAAVRSKTEEPGVALFPETAEPAEPEMPVNSSEQQATVPTQNAVDGQTEERNETDTLSSLPILSGAVDESAAEDTLPLVSTKQQSVKVKAASASSKETTAASAPAAKNTPLSASRASTKGTQSTKAESSATRRSVQMSSVPTPVVEENLSSPPLADEIVPSGDNHEPQQSSEFEHLLSDAPPQVGADFVSLPVTAREGDEADMFDVENNNGGHGNDSMASTDGGLVSIIGDSYSHEPNADALDNSLAPSDGVASRPLSSNAHVAASTAKEATKKKDTKKEKEEKASTVRKGTMREKTTSKHSAVDDKKHAEDKKHSTARVTVRETTTKDHKHEAPTPRSNTHKPSTDKPHKDNSTEAKGTKSKPNSASSVKRGQPTPPRTPTEKKSHFKEDAAPTPSKQTHTSAPEASVESIQRMVRIKQAKARIEEKKEQIRLAHEEASRLINWSTVTIQRAARGKMGRERFMEINNRRLDELNRAKLKSATKIQSLTRGVRDRARVRVIRERIEAEKKNLEWLKSFQKGNRHKDVEVPVATAVEEKSKQDKKKKESPAVSTQQDIKENVLVKEIVPDNSSELVQSSGSVAAAESAQVTDAKILEIEEKIRRLEQIEKNVIDREKQMAEHEKKAQEQQQAIQAALELMEKRAKEDAVERAQREELLALAQGAISHRSAFASSGPMSKYSARGSARGDQVSARGSARMSARGPPSSSRDHEGPPTARSARGGAGIPPDAPRMMHGGEEWVQLWDPDEAAYYWYCERTQFAQWETPGGDFNDTESRSEVYDSGTESGYESAGAMTDYSDQYSDYGGEYTDSEYGDAAAEEWQEYWDEQAQAKYWYNNNTGEASWTKPDALLQDATSSRGLAAGIAEQAKTSARAMTAGTSLAIADNPADWASFLDEETGQEYWYNSKTGQSSWA